MILTHRLCSKLIVVALVFLAGCEEEPEAMFVVEAINDSDAGVDSRAYAIDDTNADENTDTGFDEQIDADVATDTDGNLDTETEESTDAESTEAGLNVGQDTSVATDGEANDGDEMVCSPPGSYQGGLDGNYQTAMSRVIPMSSDLLDLTDDPKVIIKLTPAPSRTSFMTVAGSLNVWSQELFHFTARLRGEMDCSTGKLRAEIYNGSTVVFNLGIIKITREFVGEMIGGIVPDKGPYLSGTWKVTETDDPSFGGSGIWFAELK